MNQKQEKLEQKILDMPYEEAMAFCFIMDIMSIINRKIKKSEESLKEGVTIGLND